MSLTSSAAYLIFPLLKGIWHYIIAKNYYIENLLLNGTSNYYVPFFNTYLAITTVSLIKVNFNTRGFLQNFYKLNLSCLPSVRYRVASSRDGPLLSSSLKSFLSSLSARTSAPGGGSASAMAACMVSQVESE